MATIENKYRCFVPCCFVCSNYVKGRSTYPRSESYPTRPCMALATRLIFRRREELTNCTNHKQREEEGVEGGGAKMILNKSEGEVRVAYRNFVLKFLVSPFTNQDKAGRIHSSSHV